jgi:two-component system response regulator NreC
MTKRLVCSAGFEANPHRSVRDCSGHKQGGAVYPRAEIEREGMSGNGKIRCVVAHDHVLLRQGLRRLLEDEADLEVVAEAGDAAGTVRIVGEHSPDVVITEASVFGLGADELEQLVRQASPQSKVLFLTMREGDDRLREERAGGACAARQTSAKELGEMIRRLCFRGRAAVREMWPIDPKQAAEEPSRKGMLTAREREVLELLAEGQTVRSAAGILGLSVKTVDAHKFNLMRKLGIHNKAELVMWAIRERVVKLPANF